MKLNYHSSGDLITNSSTQTYIQATEETKQKVKDIINGALFFGRSCENCDDLFEIVLDDSGTHWGENYFINLKIKVKSNSTDLNLIQLAKNIESLINTYNITEGDC
jgi:hypothetical protein